MDNNINYEIKNIKIPMIPMRGVYIFPNTIIHFDVGREFSLNALNESMVNNSLIFLTAQKDIKNEEPKFKDLYKVGIIAEIKQTLKLPNGNMRVLVEGLTRAKVNKFIIMDGYFEVDIDEYKYNEEDIKLDDNLNAIIRLVLNDAKELLTLPIYLS